MKKFRYLFTSILMLVLSITMVEAKEAPKFTTSLKVTKANGSDTIHVEAIIKNAATSCNGVGLRNGKAYIYLDENIVKSATAITAVYRDYNETTGNFSTSNKSCSYDGTSHRVICDFGRTISNPVPLLSYSDCKDELVVNFDTELCESSDNCNIKVTVEGIAVDYNNGNPTDISSGTQVMASKNFDCDSTVVDNPTPTEPDTPTEPNTPVEPDNNYEPEENPNTVDNGMLYMLLGTLSLVLMITTVVVNKNKKNTTEI